MAEVPKNVESRAAGRPPEEATSDDALEQAAAILGDSEERVEEGTERSAANSTEAHGTSRDTDVKSG